MFEPNYTITNELLTKITEIETIRAQISSSYILPEREIEMRHRASIEATHGSTSIEGNPLNDKQVEKVLSDATDKPLTRHQYAEIEVKNYKKALNWIDKRKVKGGALTTRDILTVHQIITDGLLAKEKSGHWRFNPVYIENQNGDTLYTATREDQVKSEIEKLVAWLNGEGANIHAVIATGIFHIQFVSIHPFADGNGRTARALTMLVLGLRNYDFRGSIVLDTYYANDKREYYDSLHKSQGEDYQIALKSSLNPWLDYFTSGFLSSAKVLAATIAVLSSAAGEMGEVKRIKQDDADLLSYAKQFGSISLSEAEGVLRGVNRRTIQRKLKKLVDDGYLEISGDARSTKYIWKPRKY